MQILYILNLTHFQFNTNYKPQGFGLQGNIQSRLRNIIRIEFIKAILPVEGLSVVVPRDCSGGITSLQGAFNSVLSLPSVNVLVDEFQGNNYGTNNTIDKSLAILQYDATWRSDLGGHRPTTNRGYSLFIPKFIAPIFLIDFFHDFSHYQNLNFTFPMCSFFVSKCSKLTQMT